MEAYFYHPRRKICRRRKVAFWKGLNLTDQPLILGPKSTEVALEDGLYQFCDYEEEPAFGIKKYFGLECLKFTPNLNNPLVVTRST